MHTTASPATDNMPLPSTLYQARSAHTYALCRSNTFFLFQTRVCCVTEVCLSPDELQRCKRVHHTVVANMLWRDLNGTKARLRRRGAEGLEPGSPYARRYL